MSDLAAWLEAIGTLAVAAIAIFHDLLFTWFRRPKLHVSIRPDPPDCMMLLFGQARQEGDKLYVTTVPVYYLRIRVDNTGKRKAENVQIKLLGITRKHLDGSYVVVDEFPPMNLAWAQKHRVVLPAIYPHTYEHCDLAHVFRPSDRTNIPFEDREWDGVDPSRTILSVDTAEKSYSLPHLLQAGQYHLRIMLSSDNTAPIQGTIEIALSGQWYDDAGEMRRKGVAACLAEEVTKSRKTPRLPGQRAASP